MITESKVIELFCMADDLYQFFMETAQNFLLKIYFAVQNIKMPQKSWILDKDNFTNKEVLTMKKEP